MKKKIKTSPQQVPGAPNTSILSRKQSLIPRCMSGQSLVELLITIGIAAIIFPALMVALVATRNGKAQDNQRVQAVALMKESLEIIRVIREQNWSPFATNGIYHPLASGNTWTLSAGSDSVNGFTRQITISDVTRDNNGTIVSTGGTVDPSTKKIVISISWNTPLTTSVTTSSYISRYLKNATFTQTLYPDFTGGIVNGTAVATTSGSGIPNDGQVQLAVGGVGDWCQPQNSILSALTLPKQGNTIVATQGAAFIGTGDGTNGVSFVNLTISDPTPPATPTASILGTFTSTYQTNAIFSDGKYAYLATNGSSSQVIILDLTHTPYTKVGWIDIPSSANANGVYVLNNIAYVTSSNKLYTYDVTTKSGGHSSPLTSIAMWIGLGTTPLAKQIVVIGTHAFVGTANTLFGLQSFRVTGNGTGLQLVGVSNLTWQQASQGLFVNPTGSRAYVAFNSGGGFFAKGFFIVDTSPADPPSWWPFPNFYNIVGSYNTGATDPRGMTVATGNRAIVVGAGGTQQYQVIDISNENSPVYCGGLAIPLGISGVASVLEKDGDAYSYIITGEANNQFKIIQGGLGGQFASSGTFESAVYDAGSSVAFNQFTATLAQPLQTQLQLQVASFPPAGNSCGSASYAYVGPSGSSSAYFIPASSTSATFSIPAGIYNGSFQNPGRCFRYKLLLTTNDFTQTPLLYDATVNYSP